MCNEIITSELTIDDWNIINKSKKARRTKLDLGAKKYLSLIYVVVSIYFPSEYRFC